ncbi:unnamed protein product [Rotaria magnacalcarata]|uniref:ABC transporter ATP-binding protein n=2 Tax=Rotaria magnacalcarata TaxID=392030 RepID=A0A816T5X4_9BILA|nr:unnamed protein product [Rotaria magnacalcarata]CAF2124577.1 unnamed protein product [Rotaria magnacalcarata]
MELISIGLEVLFSYWHNAFFNALQRLDQSSFVRLLFYFPFIVLTIVAVRVYKSYMTQLLELHWRRWLTNHFLSNYLADHAYYRASLKSKRDDNPDQKISADVGSYIAHTCTLTIGGMHAIISFIPHVFILWSLSGVVEIRATQYFSYNMRGGLMWITVICAGLGTLITDRIGRNLMNLNYEQERHEANFRYGLARLRDHVESIASYHGELNEHVSLMNLFSALMSNFRQIMRCSFRLNWFSHSFSYISHVFPYMIASTRFFSKEITLGDLTQIGSAYVQVQKSFSFVITYYTTIAQWRAETQRLLNLVNTLKDLHTEKQHSKIKIIRTLKEQNIRIEGLNAQLPLKMTTDRPQILFENFNWIFEPCQSVLITGQSGCGKSTLFRILSGIWPYGRGTITMPAHDTIEFVPQKPYCPLGSLRHCLTYPSTTLCASADDAKIQRLLRLCQLELLVNRLNDVDDWSLVLSLGEQQKMIFVRVLLRQPKWIFLDEATSSLDEPSETHLYSTLFQELGSCSTIISVGHRNNLQQFHRIQLQCANRQINRVNLLTDT